MKSYIVPFIAVALLMVSDANAQCGCAGGTHFGFNYNNCDFASSLWAGYCNGGPAMPAHCGGGGCRSGCGGRGIMSQLQGLMSRVGGGSSCGCGRGWSSDYYGTGGQITGFGAYAGMVPSASYFAAQGCGDDMWWYGGGSAGRPARCNSRSSSCGGGRSRSCGGGRSRSCGRSCGGSHGLFSCFRNRLSYSSWIGGGPLDRHSLVAGYGGYVTPGLDMGCINGACGGRFNAGMRAANCCGCEGAPGEASGSYSAGGFEGVGEGEQYAPVDEGPFYESPTISEDSQGSETRTEEIPAGTDDGGGA